ncbi:MAG: glycoside hydrolase [Candidatus Binatia bacterium]
MFQSFFLAGFECSAGYNMHGDWIDQIAATQHDINAAADYGLLRHIGIAAARDGLRWPLVERGARYDFSTVKPLLAAARIHRIEVIWDLFHFGYPPDLDLLSPAFPARFAEYCYAATRFIADQSDTRPALTPINEPSYFAWAAGDAARFAPHWHGRGPELKVALARAAIRGIEAIWSACADARIVNIDALCRTVAPVDRPERASEADHFNDQVVFESWDMLCGRRMPELGGSSRHLGIVGINYYWSNQWELGTADVALAPNDVRRVSLRELLRTVWERYRTDLLITETAHVGDHRAAWLRELAVEVAAILNAQIPLHGVCLYPILGMPEWHARSEWARMGLWDLVPDGPRLLRQPYAPAMEALREILPIGVRRPPAERRARRNAYRLPRPHLTANRS